MKDFSEFEAQELEDLTSQTIQERLVKVEEDTKMLIATLEPIYRSLWHLADTDRFPSAMTPLIKQVAHDGLKGLEKLKKQ